MYRNILFVSHWRSARIPVAMPPPADLMQEPSVLMESAATTAK